MKEEIVNFIRLFIYANVIIGTLFFWFHAPKIFGVSY